MNIQQLELQALLAKFLLTALIIAAVLNGAGFWLKRVGYLEPQMYLSYLDFLGTDPDYQRTPAENEHLRVLSAELYASAGSEVLLKLGKDIWLLVFVAASIVITVHFKTGLMVFPPWPLTMFLLLVALSAIYSGVHFGPVMPLAGLRFFSFLAVALCAAWAATRQGLNWLANGLMLFMVLQFVLIPIELTYGLHMFGAKFFGSDFGDRIVGTLLQPSSLGITAILSLVYYLRFSGQRKWMFFAALITTVLVFFSASAMALLLLFLVAAMKAYQEAPVRYRLSVRVAALLVITCIILFLPEISGRWNIMDSLWGRLLPIEQYIEQNNLVTLVFGQGLGVGTNTAANLLMNWQSNQAPGYAATTIFIADATPMALIAQIGFVGLLSFYLLIAYAARKNPESAHFYLVAATASLTTNLTELFPVNMVLGIMLAHSLFLADTERKKNPIPS